MELRQGYKQTEIGVIPEDWEVVPLETFTSFISYGFTNPMPTTDSGVFMITAKDINHGRIQFSTARCTSKEAYLNLLTDKSRPQSGDLLLTKDGTLGRVALVGDQTICINQSVAVLRLNSKIVAPFLKILLESPTYQKRMLEDAGGSTIKHIYITIVNRMPVAIPPTKAEQRAITAALSDVDALITALDALIAKKRLIKQGAMQELLTGRRRLPGFSQGKQSYRPTKFGMMPTDWKSTLLQHISAFITKGSTPTTYGFAWQPEGVLFLRSECVSEHGLDLSQSMFISDEAHQTLHRGEVRSGDILMTITGNVGRVIYLQKDFGEANINQHIARIRIVHDDVTTPFLFHFLSQPVVRRYYNLITTGQAYPQISLTQVRETEVILPSLEEQRAIAETLSDMDAEIAALERKRHKTRLLKQGMMQELLTGKTRLL